ncbi:hypothetical protein [Sphingopyxis sp. PET50]|uniref:hypothetical protein n=1 Tax=Sphingopyxis sp. PET50 TaxID=2976533 RepID=UPI0021AEAA6E|nr:hypothetical protein [Sphingopyxis sp. PET50]
MDFAKIKEEALTHFHEVLRPATAQIAAEEIDHKEKAKKVNDIVASTYNELREIAQTIQDKDVRQNTLVVNQYASCVASLEYRHAVWPYEYMAFSRRVGELWERFCCTCWDEPSRPGVQRVGEPSFAEITSALQKRLPDDPEVKSVFADVWELVGEINMKEDEVFSVDDVPHVVDFKSGFGSNEKGNTLRLIGVGRAYRLWNPATQLFLLVRQTDNNNYLEVLKRSNLWQVHCGEEAYKKIDELTGANINDLRKEIVNFQEDLSENFFRDIDGQLADLRSYLDW